MRKYVAPPAVSLPTLALTTYPTPPNANLEQARSNFSALQSQPDATKVAAPETKDAGDWLAKVDKAYQDGEDQRDVDQLAYLINRHTELAKQAIALCNAKAQLQNASAQRAQARLDARIAQLGKLRSQLNARQTSRGIMVTFGDVLFDFDKPDLRPGAMYSIQQLVEFSQQSSERQVTVEDYTDSTGPTNYDQRLSERCADSVRMALLSRGTSSERVATRGYDKEYPVASNSTSSGRAMSRRVEVTISNDVKPVAPRSSASG